MKIALLSISALALALADSGSVALNIGTISSVTTSAIFSLNKPIPKHTVQVKTAGSPSTCNLQLEGTIDDPPLSGSTWANLSGSFDCSSSVTFHVVDRAVNGIRINVTALSGGTQPNVSIKYLGVQ